MIYITVASLHRKAECGVEIKNILGCKTNCPSEEEARRRMITNTDVVKHVLDGWQLAHISAHEIKPEELLTDDNLIKAFVIEMARKRDAEATTNENA